MLPDRDACMAIHDEVETSSSVREHAETVCRLALELTEHAPHADEDVVQAGALLHDIGRAISHDVDHVVEGVRLLRERGVDERVVRCVARHVGAGIEPDQARAFGWLEGDSYVPETIEERIVCHADNLTRGDRYVDIEEVETKLEAQGLEHVIDRMRELHEGLAQELGIDPGEVAATLGNTS